ncbi:LysR family transcriptional regulator [Subtercola sp. RTI3]|uniref:LysR family transcriptional regulator n=1 Tax=Subtercola sp. RTI3 TaxID=3048639 RepID=UPI002B22B7E6|nr:LysR family transcriptional regulator [Subtercola sp. RTI3]MEA9984209.1 LysR family transcriptional regulator [Subtercola sp. RTI3]
MIRSDPPDLKSLQTLAVVAELGSLTSASTALGVTQQAVSSRIRAREVRTGSPLVTRSARGSQLTEAGLLVAGWAKDVLDAAERFEVAVAALRDKSHSQLRVGASLTIAEHLMPEWLIAFQTGSGNPAAVDLVVANSRAVIEQLRAGARDIGFIETPDVPSDLESRVIAFDELVVVVGVNHPWARRRRALSAAELASTALVVREEGSGTRRTLELALDTLEPKIVLAAPASILPTTTAIRSTVASGRAPAVLSSLAIRDDFTLGRLARVRVAGLTLKRPLTGVWVRNSTGLPENAERLLSIALTHAR